MDLQHILSEWEDVCKHSIEVHILETEKNMAKAIEIEMDMAYESKLICL